MICNNLVANIVQIKKTSKKPVFAPLPPNLQACTTPIAKLANMLVQPFLEQKLGT